MNTLSAMIIEELKEVKRHIHFAQLVDEAYFPHNSRADLLFLDGVESTLEYLIKQAFLDTLDRIEKEAATSVKTTNNKEDTKKEASTEQKGSDAAAALRARFSTGRA
jgi:prepilin-type processing-associated H-X9-DG protein